MLIWGGCTELDYESTSKGGINGKENIRFIII